MKKGVLYVFSLLIFTSRLSGASISGKVQCHMERGSISAALVILLKPGDADFSRTAVSDIRGDFIFTDVSPGRYNIEVVRDGFYKNVLFDLQIESERDYTVTVKLLRKRGDDRNEYCFMLGGIEVQSESREIIPEEVVTTRKVNSGEIEHLQATNLGDILALVPGVEKNSNPGLASATMVGVRGIKTGSGSVPADESFGSMIIVDGNEIAADSRVGFSGRAGIDLRSIPADNIESVEVISGIPSVKYSNFSQGLVNVKTKTGRIAPKFKAKLNPDTRTISFIHGLSLGAPVFDYHLNYARSERDLRKVDDEFHRIYGSGNISFPLLDGRWQNRVQMTFTQMLQNEPPTDVYKTKNRDRSYRATGLYSFEYEDRRDTKYSGTLHLNVDRNKSFRAKYVNDQYPVQIDTTLPIIDGADTTGWYDTTVTRYRIGYIGEKSEIGVEWKTGLKLRREKDYRWGTQKHHFLTGVELDHQFNTGEGIVLDEDWNYYGYYSSRRSYPYDDYPSLTSLSVYFEDQMEGRLLGKKFDLMAGLRYDSFNPTGLTSADHGVFICPRLNFRYFFNDDLRVRMGAGRSAKAVSLGYIFREPKYIKYVAGDTLVEEVMFQYNPELETYTTDKYEISLDWKAFGNVGMSLTAYYMESDNVPELETFPWGYHLNPDTLTAENYQVYYNTGWKKSNGIEYTLRTKRIYNVQFKMNATYRYTRSGETGLEYDASPDTAAGDQIWYKPSEEWREKVILDYQVNYISRRLGVWVTLDVQHIPLEHRKTIYHSNASLKTFIKDGVVRQDWFYQDMTFPNYWEDDMWDYRSRWLFNFRLTKSIGHNTELSLYINNIFNDLAPWRKPDGLYTRINPVIYYGLEVSAQW